MTFIASWQGTAARGAGSVEFDTEAEAEAHALGLTHRGMPCVCIWELADDQRERIA